MVMVGTDTVCEKSQVLRFQRGPITPRIGWPNRTSNEDYELSQIVTPEFSEPSPNTLDAIAGGAADEVFELQRSDGG